MSKSLNILCTRDLTEAEQQTIVEAGINLTIEPFIKIESNNHFAEAAEIINTKQPEAIVATSKNAVPFIKEVLPNLQPPTSNFKFYAVGQHTGNQLREFAKNVTIAKSQNAAGLADQIVEDGIQKAIFFCGDKRRDELPDLLAEAEIELTEIEAYKTIYTPVEVNTEELDGAFFYSPSAVDSFVDANGISNMICFAIGPTTGSALIEAGFDQVMMAEEPNLNALLEAVSAYYTIEDGVTE